MKHWNSLAANFIHTHTKLTHIYPCHSTNTHLNPSFCISLIYSHFFRFVSFCLVGRVIFFKFIAYALIASNHKKKVDIVPKKKWRDRKKHPYISIIIIQDAILLNAACLLNTQYDSICKIFERDSDDFEKLSESERERERETNIHLCKTICAQTESCIDKWFLMDSKKSNWRKKPKQTKCVMIQKEVEEEGDEEKELKYEWK